MTAPAATRSAQERLIVALDLPGADANLALAHRLAPLGLRFVKVGMSLFYEAGLPLVRELRAAGLEVFVDLKLHDIPNTVARTVDVLVRGGVRFLNVHAQGGSAMMAAAAQAARQASEAVCQPGEPPATVIAVTLLTSLDAAALADELRVPLPPEAYAPHLAALAQAAGLDGVVCSPLEAGAIAARCGPGFLKVTPGVRPAGSGVGDDQARVSTPAGALRAGATHLVVGRPIYAAPDPAAATRAILDEMGDALLGMPTC